LNIAVHHPQSASEVNTLRKKVAAVHAGVVLRHVQNLRCPEAQKMKLHQEIKKACRTSR